MIRQWFMREVIRVPEMSLPIGMNMNVAEKSSKNNENFGQTMYIYAHTIKPNLIKTHLTQNTSLTKICNKN